MSNTQVRELTDARGAPAPDAIGTEPSHIHIPRPSRLRQAADRRPEVSQSTPVELALEIDAAAA